MLIKITLKLSTVTNYSTMLSFLLSATNASAYTNHTLGHAKFTTHVGGGGQGSEE